MSATAELHRETEAARALVAQLYPILENDDVLVRDMVEGSTDLREAIRQGVARIVEIRALLTGMEATIRVLKCRSDAFEKQEERIRAAMLTAMEVGRLRSLETNLGTVSRRLVPPSVVVTDETLIPELYWKPQPAKLDKALLRAALTTGEKLPGAELSNGGQTLAVRLT